MTLISNMLYQTRLYFFADSSDLFVLKKNCEYAKSVFVITLITHILFGCCSKNLKDHEEISCFHYF